MVRRFAPLLAGLSLSAASGTAVAQIAVQSALPPWSAAETGRTMAILRQSPVYPEMRRLSLELESRSTPPAYASTLIGDRYFALRRSEAQPAGIWSSIPLADFAAGRASWRPVLDLDALNRREQGNWEFYQARCLDRRRCLIILSAIAQPGASSEAPVARTRYSVREFDLLAGAFVSGGFNIMLDAPEIEWLDRDRLVLSTALPAARAAAPSRPSTRIWRRGQPVEQSRVVLTNPFETGPSWTSITGLTTVRGARSGRTIFFVASRPGQGNALESRGALIAESGAIASLPIRNFWLYGIWNGFLIKRCDSPEAADCLCAWKLDGSAPEVTIWRPGSRQVLVGAKISAPGVVINYLDEVNGRLAVARPAGGAWALREVETPPHASIDLIDTTSQDPSHLYLTIGGLVREPATYALNLGSGRLEPTRRIPANEDYSVEQFRARSADGTQIPYYVVRRRGSGHQPQPTLLEAYGNGGLFRPFFRPDRLALWVDRGAVFVHANVRGGSEFPGWEQTFGADRARIEEDVVAVADDLVARGITTHRQLGISGHSMGGLLSATMYNRHQDKFGAFLMLNAVLDTVSAREADIDGGTFHRFGGPDDEVARSWVMATSPLQNISFRPGAPAPFIATSTNETNVPSQGPRAFAMRLKELALPYYFWETPYGNHAPCSQYVDCVEFHALEYSYLWDRLGR